MSGALLVTGFFASVFAFCDAAPLFALTPSPIDPLAVLLYDLSFTLPPEVFSLHNLDLNVSLYNVSCTHLALGTLSLTAEGNQTRLLVAITTMDCRGAFSWEEQDSPWRGQDNASFSIVNSSISATIVVSQSADGLPNLAHVALNKDRFVTSNLRAGAAILSQPVREALQVVLDLGLDAAVALAVQAVVYPLNAALADFARNASSLLVPRPPLSPPSVPPNSVQLTNDATLKLINTVTNQWLQKALNSLIDDLTAPSPGAISVLLPSSWKFTGAVGLLNVTVALRRASITGLDHWRSFDLLRPVTNSSLESVLAFDNVSLALEVEISVLSVPGLPGGVFRESLWLNVSLDRALFNVSLTVGINTSWAESLYLLQYGQPGCLAHAVMVLNFTQIFAHTSMVHVSLSGPTPGDLEVQLLAFANNLFSAVSLAFGPGVLSALVTGIFAWTGMDAVNTGIDRFLRAQANATCLPQNRVEPSKRHQVELFASIVFPSALCVGLALSALGRRVRLRNLQTAARRSVSDQHWAGVPDDPTRPLLFVGRGGARVAKTANVATDRPKAASMVWDAGLMFTNDSTPSSLAAFAPLLFCVNVACLIVAHACVLAMARGIITAGGRTIEQVVIEYLTNYRTIAQFYEARAYIFYVVVLTGAVIVPYAQLLALIVVWAAPLPAQYREWLVWLLSTSCKLCFIEVMLPVLIPTAVYYVLPLNADSELLIAIFPAPATFVYMAYCFGSIFIVNITQWCQQGRSAVFQALDDGGLDGHASVQYSRPSHRLRRWVGLLAVATVAGLTAYVAVSAPLVTFTHLGLTGLALDNANVSRVHTFSLPALCFPTYYNPNTWTKGYLAIMFVVAAVTPLLLCAALAVMWVGPNLLSLTNRCRWQRVCDSLCAWSCPEILVVAAVSLRLELREFVLFIFGPYCKQINAILARDFVVPLDGDPRCFDVTTRLDHGFYLLLGAALGGIVLRNVLLTWHAAEIALEYRTRCAVPIRFN